MVSLKGSGVSTHKELAVWLIWLETSQWSAFQITELSVDVQDARRIPGNFSACIFFLFLDSFNDAHKV
jgi:hypothetical protein